MLRARKNEDRGYVCVEGGWGGGERASHRSGGNGIRKQEEGRTWKSSSPGGVGRDLGAGGALLRSVGTAGDPHTRSNCPARHSSLGAGEQRLL